MNIHLIFVFGNTKKENIENTFGLDIFDPPIIYKLTEIKIIKCEEKNVELLKIFKK